MRRWQWVVGGLAGLIIIGLGHWFWSNFERVEVEVEAGYQAHARRNPYLAAQRLLESFTVPVESGYQLHGLPPANGTLVLLNALHRPSRPKRTREILAWVEAGGHVLMVAPEAASEPASGSASGNDTLLEAVAVDASHSSEGERSSTATASVPRSIRESGSADEGSETLTVEFHGRRTLTGPALAKVLARADDRIHALRVRHGGGWVTVLSDDAFMRNRRITDRDHALFFWQIIDRGGPGAVWFVRGEDTPAFWKPLFKRSWAVWSSAIVLIAATLWSASRRFGPPLPAPTLGRRRLLDHIIASGDFYWRLGAGEVLVRAVRDSLERSLEFRHPGWLMSGQLAERLAQLSGITRAEVQTALSDEAANDPEQFTQTIATLERIRRRL